MQLGWFYDLGMVVCLCRCCFDGLNVHVDFDVGADGVGGGCGGG